jgi:hypothetical protein
MDDEDEPAHNSLETPGAHQMTAWTLRLAENQGFASLLATDPHLFALFYATCAAAVPAPGPLAGEPGIGGLVSEQLLPTLKDLQRQFGDDTSGRFARLYLQGVSVFPLVEENDGSYRRAMRTWRKAAERKASKFLTAQEQNVAWVADLLGLEKVERKLLIFQLNRHRPGFSQLFDLLLGSDHVTAAILADAFDVDELEVVSALAESSKLVRSGLLRVQERPLRIGEPSIHLRATLTESADGEAQFLERFVKPLTMSPSTSSLARLHEDDEQILRGILGLQLPEDHGLHSLIYGPKSVDKRDMLSRTRASTAIWSSPSTFRPATCRPGCTSLSVIWSSQTRTPCSSSTGPMKRSPRVASACLPSSACRTRTPRKRRRVAPPTKDSPAAACAACG